MRPFSRLRPLSDSSVDIDAPDETCSYIREIMIRRRDSSKDDEREVSLIPVSKLLIKSTRCLGEDELNSQLRPSPPPLPYRLTFKGITVHRRYFPRSTRSIRYMLGYASANVEVETSFFVGTKRFRVMCNKKLITVGTLDLDLEDCMYPLTNMPPVTVWSTEFKIILQSTSTSALIRVEISQYRNVSIFIDDFPVTALRRSSSLMHGSPPPHPYEELDNEHFTMRRVHSNC